MAVAHCPRSNGILGCGVAPLTALREAGIRVCIATDSPASTPSFDMFDEMRAAIVGARAREGRPDALTAADALELATRGPRGINPQVGAVLLSPTGETLAEGWHRGAGTPHAEVDALSKLTPPQTIGATAVVTLEPCNHTGRTGPCSEALIAAGVARVVYAVDDPGEHSSGGATRPGIRIFTYPHENQRAPRPAMPHDRETD